MTAQRLTFKRGLKPTGLAAVAHPYASTEIKLDGKKVGWINPPSGANLDWKVWIHKIDNTVHCGWKNVCFKAAFPDEEAARAWITRNHQAIITQGLFSIKAENKSE